LTQCGKLIESGRLQIEVAATLPLAQVAVAHRMLEAGHTQGKLVLRI
jgi:NADPH2:quinone reductase